MAHCKECGSRQDAMHYIDCPIFKSLIPKVPSVYVVTYESSGWDSYHCIEAVFSTEDKAWAYIDKQNSNARSCYDVIEFELDKE